ADAKLAGAVSGAGLGVGDHRGVGKDVDDGPPAGATQRGEEDVDEVKGAMKVGLHERVEVFSREHVERPARDVGAGAVDQRGCITKGFRDIRCNLTHSAFVTNVTWKQTELLGRARLLPSRIRRRPRLGGSLALPYESYGFFER